MKKKLFKVSMVLIIIFSAGISIMANPFMRLNSSLKQEEKKVRYLDGVFEKVNIQSDIVFGKSVNEKGENETLKLDIYSPDGDKLTNRPVIVWIHGGGFTFGNDKTQSYIVEMANRFTRKGYVGISVDYRLRAKPKDNLIGTISDAVEDALKALDWLRQNSYSLKVDTSKIIVAGGSAGGILGSNLCLSETFASNSDKSGIIGFVNLWGSPGANWGEMNIGRNAPPTIIVHGTEDASVPYGNSVALIEKLTTAGVRNELVTIEGAGHTPVKHKDDFEKKIAKFLYEIIK
jgi:acetyl esterase/lipase